MSIETAGVSMMSRDHRQHVEFIDSAELAKRLNLPDSWIRAQTRERATDPLPCLRFGRYVRFQWESPALKGWLERRLSGNK
jgi:hypothetical protein